VLTALTGRKEPMQEIALVVAGAPSEGPVDKLKREQPKLYEELCASLRRLHDVKYAIHHLREPYVVDGALAAVLEVVDDAMVEAHGSALGKAWVRSVVPAPTAPEIDSAIAGELVGSSID
jgi:hypothetical protein